MTYLIKLACTVWRCVTWLITCLLRVCSVLYCKLSASLSRQAVSSGEAGCSCLLDRPSPTLPLLRPLEVRLEGCFLTFMLLGCSVVWGWLSSNFGWSWASIGTLAHHIMPLSLAPQHHTLVDLQWDYYPVWPLYLHIHVYAPGLQCWWVVVWGWLDSKSGLYQASIGTLACHVMPLSHAPTSHACWSAVGLLFHLAVVLTYSHLCLCGGGRAQNSASPEWAWVCWLATPHLSHTPTMCN